MNIERDYNKYKNKNHKNNIVCYIFKYKKNTKTSKDLNINKM